jgi:hypothetical protein
MTRPVRLRHSAIALLLAASTLRCGGTSGPPTASAIELAGGNDQTGTAGLALSNPLVVRVTTDAGDPVQGVSVQWAAQNGGSVSAATTTTGSDGRASVTRVLGTSEGEQTTTATATGLEGSPVTFVSTALGAEGPSLGMVTQPSSSAESGVALVTQPAVRLRDADGNDLSQSGVAITASLVGAGTLGGTATVATNAGGVVTFDDLRITGAAGSYSIQFAASGFTSVTSSSITLAATPGIVITTNPPVAALNGEVFDPVVQPVVKVSDAGGAPTAGAVVTASIGSGGGTLQGTLTATTDAAGLAKFGDLGISGAGQSALAFTSGSASVTSSPVTVSPLPAEATTGKWGPLVTWDIVPLHMNLMPNGKVLAWGKTDVLPDTMGMPRLWDPAGGSPASAPMIAVDTMLFCAGHALLPDGRLLVSGGHLQDDRGIATTFFFDQNGAPTRGPDMHNARWYPTVTVLPDGRVLTMAGRNEASNVVRVPEIFEGGAWVELPGANGGANDEIPYYPRNFVAPDGRIFYAGERISARWFDVDGSGAGGNRGRWIDGPNHIWPFNRDYGTAAMYEPGKIIYAGGGGHTGWPTPDAKSNTPTATAEIIDLNQASPSWQNTSPMSSPRRHLNSTILPDGQVLVTGGTSGAGFVNIDEGLATRAAEVWNPATGNWTTLAANSKMRVYHSVSLLLPDGTVLHGASGDALAIQPGGAIVPVPSERSHEIFSPPYLFKGARPAIGTAPVSVTWGQQFAVATPNAAQITGVRWIRLGSVTHAFDMGQRAEMLQFTRTATGVTVTASANSSDAPPGFYMLFLLNRNGVPSNGAILRIQ